MSISKFAASMTFVPYMTVLMRSVQPRDKSLSLGLSSFIMMIACKYQITQLHARNRMHAP